MTWNSRTRVVDAEFARSLNAGTRVAAPLGAGHAALRAGDLAHDELRERWQEILERVEMWRAEHPEGAAMAVIVRHRERFDVALHQLFAHGADDATGREQVPVAVVVGRHSACDLVMETNHASLRHAAVIGWRDGVVAIDLRSELGLTTMDGRTARRMSSTQALRFVAASAELTTLFAPVDAPFAVRWADQLEAALSGALVDDADPPARRHAPADNAAADWGTWEKSVVVRTRVAGMPAPVVHEDQLAIRATRDAIERGVVLGRYTRCDRTTALADDVRVSRVHALVLAAYGALWVVDTASTGGTSLVGRETIDVGEGRRIARLANDARLFLAGVEAVLILDP